VRIEGGNTTDFCADLPDVEQRGVTLPNPIRSLDTEHVFGLP
jgi:hypothetical protein